MNNKDSVFEGMKPLLNKVSSIVFTNPFSTDRLNLDQEITGIFSESQLVHLLPQLITAVTGKLKILDH